MWTICVKEGKLPLKFDGWGDLANFIPTSNVLTDVKGVRKVSSNFLYFLSP